MSIGISDPLIQAFIIAILEITFVVVILTFAVSRTKKPRASKSMNPHTHEETKRSKSERKELRNRPRNREPDLTRPVTYAFLISGLIALVTSITYSSSILAFIGLGLAFWGALLLYIKPTKHVKAELVDSSTISLLTTINHITTSLNYVGRALYLPPRYLKTPKGATVFIPSKEDDGIPPADQVAEEKVFIDNPSGLCLTPPGLNLANLYENELKKDFAKADLNYLQKKLPKLLVEELEVAENFEIYIEDDVIEVRITDSIYKNLCREVRKLSTVSSSIGCPICSSIAIAIARSTGKPVVIEKNDISENGKITDARYRIIEE